MARRVFRGTREPMELEAKTVPEQPTAYSGHVLRILIAARLSHTMRGIFPWPAHQPAKTRSSMRSTRAASRSPNSSSSRTDRSLNPAPGWVSRIFVRTVLAQGTGGSKRDAAKVPSPRICSLIWRRFAQIRERSHMTSASFYIIGGGILCNGSPSHGDMGLDTGLPHLVMRRHPSSLNRRSRAALDDRRKHDLTPTAVLPNGCRT